MSAQGDPQDTEGDVKATPRSKLACKACRAIKVRCIRPPGSNTACARCSRYSLQCADPPVVKRKGRPPNSSRRLEVDTNPPPPRFDQVSQQASISPKTGTYSGTFNPSISPTVPLAQNVGAQTLVDLSNSQPAPSTSSHGLSSNSRRRSHNHNLNMAEYLDPADREEQIRDPWFSSGPSKRAAHYSPEEEDPDVRVKEADDPVSLRALSEVEANSLVQLFHERLNPLVAVLDAALHTMPYLRRTSSVLFSTVLASAARFFRHDLHPTLISHAQTVLDRALLAGSTDIGVIQSLMILTYWKEPEDTSGWMKVGMALRLGYSLFWHVPRTSPLPQDEMEARKLLNAERTWLCLFSFDRGQSYVHGLPTTMRLNHFRDPEVWAREHLYLGPSVDMHIASSVQLCKLKDRWGALCDARIPDPSFLELAAETLTSECDSLINKWFNKDAQPPCFDQEVEHVVLWSILDFVFVMKRFRMEISPHDPIRVDACLEVVSRIADEIDIVANNGMLIIMQDSASCMTANLVDFTRKAFRFCSRSQKSYVLTILHRILLAHARVTNEDSKTAPAYVARFIRRVLSVLSTESRAGTPGSDPKLVTQDSSDSQVDFFAELGLEEFMQVPDYVAQNEADDGRYWANMLLSELLPSVL